MIEDKIIEFTKDKLESVERDFDKSDNIFQHSLRVSEIIHTLTKNEKLSICGLLHDVLEDSDATEGDLISLEIDSKSISIIKELTNNNEELQENGRFHYMNLKFSNLSDEALLVKLADRYDNLSKAFELRALDIYELMPKTVDMFISSYATETLCIFLTTVGDRIEELNSTYEFEELDDSTVKVHNAIFVLYEKISKLLTGEIY